MDTGEAKLCIEPSLHQFFHEMNDGVVTESPEGPLGLSSQNRPKTSPRQTFRGQEAPDSQRKSSKDKTHGLFLLFSMFHAHYL